MDASVAPCSSTFGKPGQILHAQAREIVANVMKFMQKEAESIKTKGQPLIPFDKYKQRARMATGINETLYETIRKEAKQVEAGEAPCFSTPQKRKRKIDQAYNSGNNVDKKYGCSQCSHQFGSIFQLDHHIQMKHVRAAALFDAIAEPQQFSCVRCDYKNHRQLELYEHFKQAHHQKTGISNENLNIQSWPEFVRYPCEHCSYESDSSLTLVKHCVSCEKKVKSQESTDGAEDATAMTQSGHDLRFKCSHCSYRADRKSQLNRHMLRHVGNEQIATWLQCNHCSYRVNRMSYLKRHVLVNHAASGVVRI